MKIELYQQVLLKGDVHTLLHITKTYESNVVPHKGDFINDLLYKDPEEYEVASVIIDYPTNSCTVVLKAYEIDSTDESLVKKTVDIAISHGWNCPVRGYNR